MSHRPPPPEPPGPPLADQLPALRDYLLYIAEQHLEGDLGAKGGASDLVQGALLAAHQAGGGFAGESPKAYRGWLRRILLNGIRKFRRRWRRRAGAASELPLDAIPATGPGLTHGETPSYIARQQEEGERLKVALAALPAEQQQVIALRVDHQLSFVEIGQRLNKSADAARMMYHRALERLQGLLASEAI